MRKSAAELSWTPGLDRAAGPLYLAIADALAADITDGRLVAGARLPPQRLLAEALGIDFTTVSRAYAEAARRGLVEGRVGQGTFVRASRPAARSQGGAIDMSMNLPPIPADPALAARIWQAFGGLPEAGGLDLLFRYQEAGGAEADRAAGAAWLEGRAGPLDAGRVLVASGAQGGLLALLSVLCQPGDLLCCEALTYPRFRTLAAHLRLRLAALPMDAQGLLPEAFEALCRTRAPRALYCTPTLHNPTTATLPLARREALVVIARRHGVPIVEDDAYGALAPDAPPTLASLGPDVVYHVAGLAKSVSPALRIAYLVAPDRRMAARLSASVRATVGMVSPVMAAVASRWIEDGTAQAIRDAIRREAAERQAIAVAQLPAELLATDPRAFHLWLRLPGEWTRGEFVARLRAIGVGVVSSDAFALDAAPEAVRIGLGAPPDRGTLAQGLERMADLLSEAPALSSVTV